MRSLPDWLDTMPDVNATVSERLEWDARFTREWYIPYLRGRAMHRSKEAALGLPKVIAAVKTLERTIERA